jgi:beta-glucosidase
LFDYRTKRRPHRTSKGSTVKRFPAGFVWGTATSAYQIEGATRDDGRGESIWDRFASLPGKIADGSDGSVACEHYKRFSDDVKLMGWLGIAAYRFSVAWPRIVPAGRGGQVNERGLGFYERLVDTLLEQGIRPCVTLYHWDLPQVLEDQGGWPVRATAEAFVDYADVVTRRLGDRVSCWITHNEPQVVSMLGYARGIPAPGRTSTADALATAHHLLLSHGWAMQVIRSNVRDAEAGITCDLQPSYAASASEADQEAARLYDGRVNRWFLDPVHGRGYPADVVADYVREGHLPAGELPFVREGDLATIATPTDFLGINYYSRAILRSDRLPEAENLPRALSASDDKTDMGWENYADGLTDLLTRVHADYAPRAIYITENGAAYGHGPDESGSVHDAPRTLYLRNHLAACLRAIEAGVPLRGYFVWSLLDNYEWAEGYAKRFGIVYVDYQTQQRIPKASAHWYRGVVAGNALLDLA